MNKNNQLNDRRQTRNHGFVDEGHDSSDQILSEDHAENGQKHRQISPKNHSMDSDGDDYELDHQNQNGDFK